MLTPFIYSHSGCTGPVTGNSFSSSLWSGRLCVVPSSGSSLYSKKHCAFSLPCTPPPESPSRLSAKNLTSPYGDGSRNQALGTWLLTAARVLLLLDTPAQESVCALNSMCVPASATLLHPHIDCFSPPIASLRCICLGRQWDQEYYASH